MDRSKSGKSRQNEQPVIHMEHNVEFSGTKVKTRTYKDIPQVRQESPSNQGMQNEMNKSHSLDKDKSTRGDKKKGNMRPDLESKSNEKDGKSPSKESGKEKEHSKDSQFLDVKEKFGGKEASSRSKDLVQSPYKNNSAEINSVTSNKDKDKVGEKDTDKDNDKAKSKLKVSSEKNEAASKQNSAYDSFKISIVQNQHTPQAHSKDHEDMRKKEQDFVNKIKELETSLIKEKESLKTFKATHDQMQEQHKKELKEKENALSTITITNSKLRQSLEELRKEVDEQLDKVSFKQVSDKMKKDRSSKVKDTPLEIVLKVKDKELKNAVALVEILTKDNEQLKKSLEVYGEYKTKLELQDKAKAKENQNNDLIQEIKLLNRQLEEHKRCANVKKEYDTELKILKDDLKKANDNIRELKDNIKNEQKKYSRAMEQIIELKKYSHDSPDRVEHDDNSGKINIQRHIELNHDQAVKDILLKGSKLDKSSNVNVRSSSVERITEKNPNPFPNSNTKEKEKDNMNNNQQRINNSQEKDKYSKFLKDDQCNMNITSIFTQIELQKLENVFTQEEFEKFLKKIHTLEHSKFSAENKHKSDYKIYIKKLNDQDEQIEYLNIQIKEAESKLKILQFQVNEYKNEQKTYQKKLTEMQGICENYQLTIKEKEQENKLLTHQMNSLRKLIKHGALNPLDGDLAKHLEKIKNENSFDSEIKSLNNQLTGEKEEGEEEENEGEGD